MSESTEAYEESTSVGPQPNRARTVPTAASDSRRKSPFLACVLSLMPGLGQVYVGYYQRGFIHIAVVSSLIAILVAQSNAGFSPLIPLGSIFLAFFWLYNVVDAGRRAALYNEMLDGRTDIELPQDFATPGLSGSVAGGVATALVGLILLLNTRFDMSLDWLEEWWPVALIAFGAYLVYKAKQEPAKPASGEFEGD